MWRYRSCLLNTCAYIGKKLEWLGIPTTVSDLWSKGEMVSHSLRVCVRVFLWSLGEQQNFTLIFGEIMKEYNFIHFFILFIRQDLKTDIGSLRGGKNLRRFDRMEGRGGDWGGGEEGKME